MGGGAQAERVRACLGIVLSDPNVKGVLINIFGGITRTTLPITQIFYPSTGYLGQKGVLVGCYNFGADAVAYGALPPPERIAHALADGTKIHAQYPAEYENGFSVPWHRVPFTKGGWANWDGTGRRDLYPILSRPDGRIYLAGEHMTYLTGWMAGALESARLVVRAIHARAAASPPQKAALS